MKRIIIFLTISIGLLMGCQKKQSYYNIELLSYHWKLSFHKQNDTVINKSFIYGCPLYVKVDSLDMAWVCFNKDDKNFFSYYKVKETIFKELINEINKIPRDTTFCHINSLKEQPRIYDGPWIRLRVRKDGNIKNILITDPEQVKGTAMLKFYRSFGKIEQLNFTNHSNNDTALILKSRQVFINSISNFETNCISPP